MSIEIQNLDDHLDGLSCVVKVTDGNGNPVMPTGYLVDQAFKVVPADYVEKSDIEELIEQLDIVSWLTPEIIELVPGFKPHPENEGDAGADLRANIAGPIDVYPLSEDIKQAWNSSPGTPSIRINGKVAKSHAHKSVQLIAEIQQAQKDSYKGDLDGLYVVVIKPGRSKIIPAGFKIALPKLPKPFLAEYQIRSRSGLASKLVKVANSPGTIDS